MVTDVLDAIKVDTKDREADRERNRKEFPKTAKIMDIFVASKPRLIYAIEDGKQLGKPDALSLATGQIWRGTWKSASEKR